MRYFNFVEIGQETRTGITRCRPSHALAGGADHAIEINTDFARIASGFLHRRDVPGNQHFRRPGIAFLTDGMLPDAIPVVAESVFIADHGILDAIGQIQGEVVTHTAVTVVIDHQIDAIHRGISIAARAFARTRNRCRLGIAEADGQAFGRCQYPGLGRIGSVRTGQWLNQFEIGDVLRTGPFTFGNFSVDGNAGMASRHEQTQHGPIFYRRGAHGILR